MKMFVANGTHQNIDFQYRLPEHKSYRQQSIPIGGQIQISGDLSAKDIDAIAEHHAIYGMIPASEIAGAKDFLVPCVYSIGDPVPQEVISALIVQNREFNMLMGVKQRREAAITVNQQVEDYMPGHIKNLEMTVEELPSKDRDPTINEGVRVTRDRDKGAPQEPPAQNNLDFSLVAARRAVKRSMF
jgi:hypothetical protein